MTLTSFLDAGAGIIAQPVTIRFEHRGEGRRYTPGFLVRWGSGRAELVEIKYRSDLRAQWTQLRPAFAAARAWAGKNGAGFCIVRETAIRGPRLEAAKRLLPLRSAPLDPLLAEAALAAARRIGSLTLGVPVEALPAPREVALTVIWRLLARGQLCIDLTAPIAPTSWVSVP